MALDPKIVADWIAFQHLGHNHKDVEPLWPAWEAVDALVRDDPEGLWLFVLTALKADSSDKIVGALSAGPLEDLLSAHGPSFIDRVEVEARRNPQFAHLLGGVWRLQMTNDVWERVQAVWDLRGWGGAPAA